MGKFYDNYQRFINKDYEGFKRAIERYSKADLLELIIFSIEAGDWSPTETKAFVMHLKQVVICDRKTYLSRLVAKKV